MNQLGRGQPIVFRRWRPECQLVALEEELSGELSRRESRSWQSGKELGLAGVGASSLKRSEVSRVIWSMSVSCWFILLVSGKEQMLKSRVWRTEEDFFYFLTGKLIGPSNGGLCGLL